MQKNSRSVIKIGGILKGLYTRISIQVLMLLVLITLITQDQISKPMLKLLGFAQAGLVLDHLFHYIHI